MARGGEELGIIWHRMGTWQGRMKRCSHDVAAVKNQEERGADGIGLEGERVVTMIVSILLLLFFLKYFHVFSKFMSTIYQQLKDGTFQFSPACCSAGLFSVLACFFDRFVQWLPYAHVEGTQGRKVCLRKSPQKQQLVTLLWNIVLFYTITLRQNVTSCPHILCLSW